MSKRWVAPLAVAMALLFLMPYALHLSFALASVLAFVAAIGVGLAARHAFRYDPYDLKELSALHDKEELDNLDVGDVSTDAGTVVCPHCGRPYKRRFPICPNCKV